MSSISRKLLRQATRNAKRIYRQATREERREIREREKRYTSFSIFTKYGENRVVKSDRPMTLIEAQYHFGALSISGNY